MLQAIQGTPDSLFVPQHAGRETLNLEDMNKAVESEENLFYGPSHLLLWLLQQKIKLQELHFPKMVAKLSPILSVLQHDLSIPAIERWVHVPSYLTLGRLSSGTTNYKWNTGDIQGPSGPAL